jgi:hypothetical protein
LGRFYSTDLLNGKQLFLFDKVRDNKISIQLKPDKTFPPQKSFVGTLESSFAAGVFGGVKETMLLLAHAGIMFFLMDLLEEEKADNEQTFLSKMYWRKPDLFNVLSPNDFPKTGGHCAYVCV